MLDKTITRSPNPNSSTYLIPTGPAPPDSTEAVGTVVVNGSFDVDGALVVLAVAEFSNAEADELRSPATAQGESNRLSFVFPLIDE